MRRGAESSWPVSLSESSRPLFLLLLGTGALMDTAAPMGGRMGCKDEPLGPAEVEATFEVY